jgi:hypothetical protein
MGRTWAIVWHASFSIIGGVLYFLCVLPRWYELTGEVPHALAMAGRITAGALSGLAALPVVFTRLRTRRPELGTPQLALSIRLWSIVAHVLAGVLIIGTAISEIWLSLDSVGQWLFGIYGAAAAIAVLGIFAFYLAFVAELPPPPPKPIKLKEPKQKRGRRKKADEDDEADEAEEAEDAAASEEAEETEAADDADEADEADDVEAEDVEAGEAETTTVEASEPAEATVESPQVTTETPKPDTEADAETQEAAVADDTEATEEPPARLRNRRPTGKTSHRRRRTRGGVALDD